MTGSRGWTRNTLGARLAVVEAARRGLGATDPHADAALRRIAGDFRDDAAGGREEIAAAAAAVVAAGPSSIAAAAERLAAALRAAITEADPGAGIALVAWGEDAAGRMLVDALDDAGRRGAQVGTGREADEVLAGRDVELVVLGLDLPDLDGRELLARIRRRPGLEAVPVIVLADPGDTATRLDWLARGADEVLPPDADPAEVVAVAAARLRRIGMVAAGSRLDVLTGLPNRTAFLEAFERAAALARRQKEALAVAVIAPDWGLHTGGAVRVEGELLTRVGAVLSGCFRRSDLVARWAEDTFAVLLPNTDEDGAALALEKALAGLHAADLPAMAGAADRPTFSAGVTRVGEDASPEVAIERAEVLLRQRQAGGRGGVRSSRDGLALRTIRIQRAYLERLFESAPEAIVVVDEQGRVLRVNREFTTIFGHQRGDSLGRPLRDLVLSDNPAGDASELVRLALSGETVAREAIHRHRSGRWIHVSVLATRIKVDDGQDAVYAIFRDITDRKRVERELVEAKEAAESASGAKSEFLSRMSHELRTPLNSVIGFTNILLKNKGRNFGDTELNYLGRILANGKHLLGLINDVLDLSKIEARRLELDLRPVDLERLVLETGAQFEAQVHDREIGLAFDLPSRMASLETDEARLRQVLVNLIGNATKFTESGGIAIGVQVEPDTRRPTRIDVSDSGIGIPADRLAVIFEAFEQADSTTTRRYGGTGLGLAISRSLCELMGYRLCVVSEEGAGSTFSILLTPAAIPPTRPIPPRREAFAAVGDGVARGVDPDEPVSLEGTLVLVIDDEADSRHLLSHTIEEFGGRVVEAGSGDHGLRIAREFRPDLITLDIMMPGMSGLEVLRRLKADPELRPIPVVVASVVASENRANLLGAVDILEKPVDRRAMLRTLRRTLDGSAGRVLIIDDDPDARELLQLLVREEGLTARAAGDGPSALRILDTFLPDLILLDLMMPGMDGLVVLDRIRQNPRFPGVPVVVVTAKELTTGEVERLGRGASAVLHKGGELEAALLRVLRQTLGRRAPGPGGDPVDP